MPANPFQSGYTQAFIDLGAETAVNVETTSNQQNPTVTYLSDDKIVVAWESNAQDGSGLGIFARIFSADGVALTGDIQINQTTTGNQAQPAIVPISNQSALVVWTSGGDIFTRGIRSDGTFPAGEQQLNDTASAGNYEVTEFASQDMMVTWEAPDGVSTSTGVFGQRLAFTGAEEFTEIRINDETSRAQRNADTAELESGQSVYTVFQSQGQTGNVSDQGVYMRFYSNTSTLGGTDILIADEVGELETRPQITAMTGGAAAVAWVNATTGELWAETFFNTGIIGSTQVNVSGAVGVNTTKAPIIEGLPNSRYVVVWEDNAGLSPDTYYKVLEADGTTVTTGLVHTNTSGAQNFAQVHVMPQGGFITVLASAGEIVIVRHAEDGTPVGPPQQVEYPVNTATTNLQSALDVSISEDGEIVVAWQSQNQDGSGLGVYFQRFATPELGTALNDVLDGDADADFIAGWLGDDTLKGFGGDDRLDGGLGNDQLVGGPGNDILIGGFGSDQISGGNDDDNIIGGEDADLLFGNGGGDIITGDGGMDTIFGGAGSDNLTGGADADEISGQGAADTLSGDGGNDILRGGSGNDSLLGGDDNDQLQGQGNNDTLDGGNGNDTLLGGAGSDDLRGGADEDRLTGADGADTLDGGTGNDTLNGGADNVRDTFVFMVGYEQDRINAFDQAGNDRLALDADLWVAVNPNFTEQQVVDNFGSLNGTGTILTLDFGGGDILEIQNAGGITQATLGTDVVFI